MKPNTIVSRMAKLRDAGPVATVVGESRGSHFIPPVFLSCPLLLARPTSRQRRWFLQFLRRFHVSHQLHHCGAQRVRQLVDDIQGRHPLAALDERQVGSVNVRQISQSFLANLREQTATTDDLPESGSQFGGFHRGSWVRGRIDRTRMCDPRATVL